LKSSDSLVRSQPAIIVDGHEDIAFNALQGRDFLKSALEKRVVEGVNVQRARGTATVGLPELLRGGVRVVFATIWVAPAEHAEFAGGATCYRTPEEAHEQAKGQLEYYVKLTANPLVRLVRTRSDLEFILASKEPRIGLVLLMEGADPLITPNEARSWFDAGVRIIAPAWHRTRYAGGTGDPGPLTPAGRELMVQMKRAGVALDVSHLAEESFFEALELFDGPLLASHSNCRAYVPTDRQLSDEMIQALVKRNAVIGIVPYNKFLKPDWKRNESAKSEVTLSDVVRHMKHVWTIAGDTLHVAIGSDFDGGFGAESIPAELDTVADLQKIGSALRSEQLPEAEVRNILSENWLSTLRRILPGA